MNFKIIITNILLLLFVSNSFAQNSTLSGYIKDANTGEILIGATIYDINTKQFSVSNNYGFYSFSLLTNTRANIEVSYIGYDIIYKEIEITQNLMQNFYLNGINNIDELVIVAKKERPIEKRTEMSVVSIPLEQVKNLPAIGGESDIIKSLQLMPGIQSGNEGSSQLFVRGGSSDQNLVLLDDIPMYYVSHLGGFVSTFNTDAINDVKLIKGGFPAIYGSRLSSVMDIRMKEGNAKKFEGNAMIGMIASKISIKGPIKKDTTSYIISARRLLYDLISRAASSMSSKVKTIQGYHFYDVNAKVNHHFSDKNHLYFSAYFGDDSSFYKTKDKDDDTNQSTNRTKWGNNLLALRWNHLFNSKLFSNTTLSYTRYRFSNENETKQTFTEVEKELYSKFKSGIYDASAKIDFEYFATPKYKLKFGVNGVHHTYNPGISSFIYKNEDEVKDTVMNNQKPTALEAAIYVENKVKLGKRLSANLGLRYNIYSINNHNFQSFEPRLLGNFLVTDDLSIKASYAEMQQNIHLLTTSGVGMPIDLWVPATEKVIPEKSKQYAFGVARTINKKYEASIEGYYKELENLTAYKEGASFVDPTLDWQDKVEV